MRNPIDALLEDHHAIMAKVADLRVAVRNLEERGEAAEAEALPALRAAGEMMTTQLLLHAKKEDEALFPALEAVFGTEMVPQINNLLAEGSLVTVDLTLRGSLPNGEALAVRVLSLFELQDRKIARQTLFFDTEEMARRLGDRFREAAAA